MNQGLGNDTNELKMCKHWRLHELRRLLINSKGVEFLQSFENECLNALLFQLDRSRRTLGHLPYIAERTF